MPKLFHLRASPRRDSASGAGADAFLARFRETHPGWDFDTLDLWRESLPEFDGAALEAKYARTAGRPFDDPQRDAFAVIERMVVRLALGDPHSQRQLHGIPLRRIDIRKQPRPIHIARIHAERAVCPKARAHQLSVLEFVPRLAKRHVHAEIPVAHHGPVNDNNGENENQQRPPGAAECGLLRGDGWDVWHCAWRG